MQQQDNNTRATDELIEKLVEALKFYASKSNWEDQENACGDPECCGYAPPNIPAHEDGGDLATEALAIAKAHGYGGGK